MFKDETRKVTIDKVKFSDADHSKTLDLRFDIEIPVADWGTVHHIIGDLIRKVADENVGFGQMQFMQELPVYDLQFAPTAHGLRTKEHRTDIAGVQFSQQLIVVRRVGKDEDKGEEKFFLLLRTKLPRTVANADFVRDYAGEQVHCRFVDSQRELPLDEKGEEEECKKEQATA